MKLLNWLPEDRRLELVGDSEYACKTLVKNLPESVVFTGPNPKGRRGEKAIAHTLAVVFATYAIVVLWYFEHGEREEDVA